MSLTRVGGGEVACSTATDVLTVGVKEEFLLLDPVSGRNRAVAEEVIAGLPDAVRGRSRPELRRSTVAMTAGVCTDLTDLRSRMVGLRGAAADAAAGAGARLVAIGATPVGEDDPGVARDGRHRAIVERYGPVALDPAVCGMRVYVGVPDRETAVQAGNRLQIWLPVIRALGGNSPVFRGADTGYVSWRTVQLLRWPSMGPAPWLDSAGDYDRTVAELIASGAVFDDRMVYWYSRVSHRHPTIEIRVNDVCADVDDAVLVIALIRAAVATAITDARAERPVPRPRDCVLAGAHWRAARDGLAHTLLDVRLGRNRPAWELVNEFFAVVSPALLAAGDLDLVLQGLSRLRRHGDGAARQRAALRDSGDLKRTLAAVAELTVAG
jgi:carboxylate-amine ligase